MTQLTLSNANRPHLPSVMDALGALSSIDVLEAIIRLATEEKSGDGRTKALYATLQDGVPIEAAVAIAWSCASSAFLQRPDWLKALWEEAEDVRHQLDLSDLVTERERAPLPAWWGTRVDAWAEQEAPEIPESFRKAVGWALLSDLLGRHANVPLGAELAPAVIAITVSGANAPARARASSLVGELSHGVSSSLAEEAGALAGRLLAVEPDVALTLEALREQQTGREASSAPALMRLIAEAHDARERLQAMLGGMPVVNSTDEALDRVTEAKIRITRQLAASPSDTVNEVVSAFSGLVRRMAVLVAVVEGSDVVTLTHQLIALDSAEGSLAAVLDLLEARSADEQQTAIVTPKHEVKNILKRTPSGTNSHRGTVQ